MFVVLLKYIKPLAEVDRYVAEHREFLARHYAAGDFILSGRQEPRVGGVILARAASRAEIEAILREDPFQREPVAEYEVIEFLPTMAAPEVEGLRVAVG